MTNYLVWVSPKVDLETRFWVLLIYLGGDPTEAWRSSAGVRQRWRRAGKHEASEWVFSGITWSAVQLGTL